MNAKGLDELMRDGFMLARGIVSAFRFPLSAF